MMTPTVLAANELNCLRAVQSDRYRRPINVHFVQFDCTRREMLQWNTYVISLLRKKFVKCRFCMRKRIDICALGACRYFCDVSMRSVQSIRARFESVELSV